MDQPRDESLFLDGPAGRLEARLRGMPEGKAPVGAAVLFHPHPLFGGSIDNKTLYRIAQRLPIEAAHATLRINFRGVGDSEGTHDEGRGEVEDAMAAIDYLANLYPGLPLTAIGYSFGAAIGLRPATVDPRVVRLIALGLPLTPQWNTSYLARTGKPRHFVQGEKDEFANAVRLESFARTLTGPVQMEIIPGASHLFTGQEDLAVDAVVRAVNSALPS